MPDAAQTPSTGTLTLTERDALVARLRTAWSNLPPETQAAVQPALDEGHQQLAGLVSTGAPPSHHSQMTLRLKSFLTDDRETHLAKLDHVLNPPRGRTTDGALAQPLATAAVPHAITSSTAPDGSILGTGKYQQLDPRWELVAGTVWLEHLLLKHPFPAGAPDSPEPVSDNISLALLSDWGTGNFGTGDAPSVKISRFVPTLQPDYTVHLGDVYYAGQADEVRGNFLDWWPQGSSASFALNSNHDMYSGGRPYFEQVIGSPLFNKLQSPWSFFALENAHWMVIGLDSAYFSSAAGLYLDGTLGQNNTQTQFLQRMAQRAGQRQQRVILLTHHNAIPYNGASTAEPSKPLQLYTNVMEAFAGQPAPAYWFYGHEHVGAAYAPLEKSGIRCRCIGHGALPWGRSSGLASAKAAAQVEWYEDRFANDPNDPLRVYNGFATLQLEGANLTETFYDELGQVAWQRRDGQQ